MKYTVAVAYSLDELFEDVRCLIEDGWKPQGGICVVIDDKAADLYRRKYYQAMVQQ